MRDDDPALGGYRRGDFVEIFSEIGGLVAVTAPTDELRGMPPDDSRDLHNRDMLMQFAHSAGMPREGAEARVRQFIASDLAL